MSTKPSSFAMDRAAEEIGPDVLVTYNQRQLALRIDRALDPFVRDVKALRAAIRSLMDEQAGKGATDWRLVNDALVSSGQTLALAEKGEKP